ncbi:DUF6311 domain-containing protein [Mariniflexile jejuense]|uniref:DUF6311 domain-containing protein n=1 Tax=Mariniflexile jejuense TaxID=1173582 RepID=A0ABW3JMM7_9FLAO
MYNLCIVIPCYNEAGYFLHSNYISFLKKNNDTLICFVNDGSSDSTSDCISSLKDRFPDNVEIVSHSANQGKAAAVKTGMDYCNTNFNFKNIAYLDADLSVSLEECYNLMSYLDKDIDFVFGSRVLRIGANIERKKSRHYIGRIISTLISIILSLKVYDTQCGCKIFKENLSKEIFKKPFISKWLFDVEIFFRILKIYGKELALTKMLEIPLKQWIDRGDSKVKITYFFKLWIDLLRIKKEYSDSTSTNLKNKKTFLNLKPNWLCISAILLCLLIFQICYGLEIIIPTNINWLLSAYHDWGQHYLGWTYFRSAPWGFPLGDMYNYYYPLGTNVGFTDSIPLLALILKPFSELFPEDFQYLGAFMFSAFILSAIYTLKILRLYKVNPIISLGATVFVIASPLLLYRGMHPALTAHWLILASFYYYLSPNSKLNPIKANWRQVLIFVLSAGIHPYLAAMVFGFSITLPLKNYFFDKSLSLKKACFFPVISLVFGLILWYVLGMISFGNDTGISNVGNYGESSFNLNSFFNPHEYTSQFLSGLPIMSDNQMEGFSYLGLGLIIIAIIALLYLLFLVVRKKILKTHLYTLPLIILTVLLLLFAISHVVTLGQAVLFEVPIPDFVKNLGSIFRAHARFCWPFYYLFVIFSIILFSKLPINNILKTSIFVGLLAFQIYDIKNSLTSRDLAYGSFDTKLEDDKKWIQIFSKFDEIITYPPFENSMAYTSDYQDLMYLANKAKKPISVGYVARMKPTHIYTDSLERAIVKGGAKPNKKTLFITTPKYIDIFKVPISQNKFSIKKLDDFLFIYPKEYNIESYFKDSEINKKFVDSIYSTLMSDIQKGSGNYLKIDNVALENKNPVRIGLDELTVVDNLLKIRGWAFDETVDLNVNDSVFITLTNKTTSYLFNTKLISRPDVTVYFKKKNIDSCGFNASIFGDKLANDIYDIGITIKNKKIKAYGKTESHIQIKSN